jgi:hypothetical protein
MLAWIMNLGFAASGAQGAGTQFPAQCGYFDPVYFDNVYFDVGDYFCRHPINAIQPIDMDFDTWASKIIHALDLHIYVQPDQDTWQTWARFMCDQFPLNTINFPSPNDYSDWRAWAFDFLRVVTTIASG